jgi:DNA-directed RNA polymerase specialized sigma subunit
VPQNQTQVDCKEIVEKICHDSRDRIIMQRLTEGGYKLDEVAVEVGITPQRVCQIQRELKRKLVKGLQK